VRISPARDRDGRIERLISVARDLTELRQAQQIALQAEKLPAAGRMAATIAHEINNPLEAVTNFIYLARTTPGMPEDSARHLEIADRELARVAQIAQKTLGFYRDTSRSKWVDVSELIDDVMLVYERKLRHKHIEAKILADSVLKLFAKIGELKQALSNLVANAIDASGEGGKIWVRAHASANRTNGMEPGIRFTVADNGSGMAPDVQKRISIPFFTTKGNIGTGIGLWVTRSIIEQQGGFLRFRSRQGHRSGTIMSFFVPASSPTHDESPARA
jgi:signal transduction histidine kinase